MTPIRELVVDNFAGGGGASEGIFQALGVVHVAINHDGEAIAMHAANHPDTRHEVQDVWAIDPEEVTAGRPVGLAWFSPDCKHFSKAKGGRPVQKKIRDLAWVVVRWARLVAPRVICVENVEEFQDWGPLEADKPCPDLRGLTFRRWVRALEGLGYQVGARELRACDYGAPTSRKRLFVIARRDGRPICWPNPSHGPGRPNPYRTAAECLDFSIPCPSIFGRKRPLRPATHRRIAKGIFKHVLGRAEPFIIPITHHGDDRCHAVSEPLRTITSANRGEFALIAPTLMVNTTGHPGRPLDGQAPTITTAGNIAIVAAFLAQHNTGMVGHTLDRPLSTITQRGSQQQLVTSHLLKLRHYSDGQSLEEPLHTVAAGGQHFAEVRAFLLSYYGTDQDPRLQEPLPTTTTRDRFALVAAPVVRYQGEEYLIADIGMRMLTPRELFRAQGFPDSYCLDPMVGRKRLTKTAQIRMCGNSVCPDVARAIVAANVTLQELAACG